MAAKSRDLPGHRWDNYDVVELPMGNFFMYHCARCGFSTLNGAPMPAPFDTKCERPPK